MESSLIIRVGGVVFSLLICLLPPYLNLNFSSFHLYSPKKGSEEKGLLEFWVPWVIRKENQNNPWMWSRLTLEKSKAELPDRWAAASGISIGVYLYQWFPNFSTELGCSRFIFWKPFPKTVREQIWEFAFWTNTPAGSDLGDPCTFHWKIFIFIYSIYIKTYVSFHWWWME